MPQPSDKIMFEIYRQEGYSRLYRVVYFTELNEHNKEAEINAAMAGEHFMHGFLTEHTSEEGKKVIERVLARLNGGEALAVETVESLLQTYLA